MGKDFIIRKCENKDLPEVINLLEQLSEIASAGDGFILEDIQKMHLEMEHFPQIYLNLVCEEDNGVIGFISLIFYKTYFHKGGTALINELIVDKKVRGLGVGRKLIENAILEAKNRGMDEIEVSTEKTNLAAQRVYKKAGFDEECFLFGMEF
jgi:ribosomal protein S18 acetylase RimI-like enzyme